MNQAELQALLDRQINKGNIYNMVVGFQSQGVQCAAAAGVFDPMTGASMTVETPYFIASVTKLYTTTLIMKLHEQGLLDLDAVLSSYLPAALIDGIHVYKGKDYSSQIKVYQLVNQTSGLADYFEGKPQGGTSMLDDLTQGRDRAIDIQQVTSMARKLPPRFEPGHGTKAHYADTNFQLLGAVIESVTGRSFSENFQSMIANPLGLNATYVYNSALLHTRPAPFYYHERQLNLPNFLSSCTPDGGLVSTVSEGLVFLRAFFEGKLFDSQLFKRMMHRWNGIFFPIQYGYGMMRFKLPRIFSPFKPTPEFIGHSGSTGSFAYYCPEKALYIAGTVNQIAAPRKAFQLMMQIADAVR